MKLTYAGWSKPDTIEFEMTNKVLNKTEKITMNVAYYHSYFHYNRFTE